MLSSPALVADFQRTLPSSPWSTFRGFPLRIAPKSGCLVRVWPFRHLPTWTALPSASPDLLQRYQLAPYQSSTTISCGIHPDTSMADLSNNSSAIAVMMTPWLHFTGGDDFFFKSLHPSSHGAIAAASIVLALLAICERWVAAMRGVLERHWARAAAALTAPRALDKDGDSPVVSATSKDKAVCDDASSLQEDAPEQRSVVPNGRASRTSTPFIASYDLPRGAMFALQALLAYLLMLAVMTFQAAYIISIVAGLGIGEVFFGRLGPAQGHNFH